MTDREIDLLDHELLLRGINMNIPASVLVYEYGEDE